MLLKLPTEDFEFPILDFTGCYIPCVCYVTRSIKGSCEPKKWLCLSSLKAKLDF